MKEFSSIKTSLLIAAAALLPMVGAVAAEPVGPPQPAPGYGPKIDWVEHTQQTLKELKGDLNLAPAQMAAWDAWSSGVVKDAGSQLSRMKDMPGPMWGPGQAWDEGTTPERMARGIERMRAQVKHMQEHLTQLEASQARTKTFYDQLDANQKTIFDLFWRDVHHRMGEAMGGGPMMGGWQGPGQ